MKKSNIENSDAIGYFKTLEALKQHPDIKDYRKQYHDLRQECATTEEIKQFCSAHTTLRRLDKKGITY